MTDPMEALRSLQIALDKGLVLLQPCEIYPNLRVILDQPQGKLRITYANVQGGKVVAIALFAEAGRIEGIPCFQLGYAVIESMRKQGLASEIVSKGMEELINGLKRNGAKKFYVEAVIGTDNEPSNRLAKRLLSVQPEAITDEFSNEPAFQYLKLVEA